MFNVVSLFSGAMGLDLGLEAAGLTTRLAVEHDPWCCQTIRTNRPELPLLERDITTISTATALAAVGLRADDVFLVCGGPPCQPFSTAGKRESIGDPRGSLFRDFVRFVEEIRPPFFLMENVRGILSAAIKHRPLDRRNDPFAPLDPDELLGSALRVILEEFQRIGYTVNYRLVMAADYGVPQIRERVIFLGSRDGLSVAFPEATHAKRPGDGKLPWFTLGEALAGLHDPAPQFQAYSKERERIFRMVPPGGNWRSLPKELQPQALGGAYHSTGGRVGFYRRLAFDEPAPTVLTSMTQKGSGMCHPVETRPLSVAECRRLQQFPDGWQFAGSIAQQYRQIGNAVPCGLGQKLGEAILAAVEQPRQEVEATTMSRPLVYQHSLFG
ncbi:MAG: DNA cytosine methyltransferase [Chloroflexaceae bacterium]|jgi:DNA (cytosine-5)-methyltransferase 1|nr:DNA cytosine methyltransferase [Chloroflexaceae bacterium]